MGTNVLGTRNYNDLGGTADRGTRWGAIFGGTFVYLAILATFGLMLGTAIFASAGWSSMGFLVWDGIVAIIALYVAGRATAHLAGVGDRSTGMWHGIITFGMCFLSTLLLFGILARAAAPYSAAAVGNRPVAAPNLLSIAARGGWVLWIAMLLGFIASALGASHVSKSVNLSAPTTGEPTTERTAERTTEAERKGLRRIA